jgi:single-stranded-DNA-specific exonuclease
MKSYSVREFKGDTLLDHLLHWRGIATLEERENFLNPSYDLGLNDPFLLSDMQKAVDRINAAITQNERIVIFGDYDADGIPGAVTLTDFFKMIGYENVGVYIPHRHEEGFGLNLDAIRSLAAETKLLITIDCGITDVEEVALAKELGLEVIITDHHLPGPVLPDAVAIVNPKTSPDYPDEMICGSGTVFKLVQGLLKDDRRGVPEGKEKWLLDMVGIATLSDMVPLKGENRVLAHYGLKVLRKSPRIGLKTLLSSLKISQKDLTEDDIAFMITPRINVASRMGHPIDAFRLLSTNDPEEAKELVEKLNALNDERKGVVGGILKEIKNKAEKRHLEDKKVIVLGNPSWKPAVLGLVANSLIREYQKPVFLWGRSDAAKPGESDILKGSCRSEGQTDMVALMHAVEEGIFIDRGGHKMSGGFSLLTEHAHLLDEALNASYEKSGVEDAPLLTSTGDAEGSAGDGNSSGNLIADHLLLLDDIDFRLWDTVDKLAPFGVDNAKPVFLLKKVVPVDIKKFGKKKEHVEIVFAKQNGKKVSAIAFFAEDDVRFDALSVGTPFDLVATLEKSMFKSFPELRLRIVEVC